MGCLANMQPSKMSNPLLIPLKMKRAPNLPRGRRLPFDPNNCRESLTGTKQIPGKAPFLEVALPFLPLISVEKKLFREQLPRWDPLVALFLAPISSFVYYAPVRQGVRMNIFPLTWPIQVDLVAWTSYALK